MVRVYAVADNYVSAGVAPLDPKLIFQRDPTRKGFVLDFTTATGSALLSTAPNGWNAGIAPPPTNGQTIGLAIAARHTDPLAAGLGANFVSNGDFSSGTTGWTPGHSTLAVVGGKLEITATDGSGATASQDITTEAASLYLAKIKATKGTSAQNNSVLTMLTSAPFTIMLNVASGAARDYVAYFASIRTDARLRLGGNNISGTEYYDDVSIQKIPALGAVQSTAGLRPVWSSANGGKVVFDVDDVLPVTVPTGFTGSALFLLQDGTVTRVDSVTVGTTYNFNTSCKQVIIAETISAEEQAAVTAYYNLLPIT